MTERGSEWISTRYLRDFGASKGINGHEETSKLFGHAADRIDWLEKKVIEVQGQLIERNAELASAMEYGHKHRLAAALARPEGSFTKADLFHAMDLVRSSGSTHTNHEIFGWMNGVTISERAPQQRSDAEQQ